MSFLFIWSLKWTPSKTCFFFNILSREKCICKLENNNFDLISIVNNSVGQANQNLININPIRNSRYVVD